MPVTTLLKAIGLTNEDILKQFFAFDSFQLARKGSHMDLVPERPARLRWPGSDLLGKDGSRFWCRRTSASRRGTSATSSRAASRKSRCPTTTSLCRTLAENIVATRTPARCIASANDEITDELLEKLLEAGVAKIHTIYTNDLDQGPYIAQTLKTDDTPDQLAARVAIYRMMRPGEPPTEKRSSPCSTACSSTRTVTIFRQSDG